MNRLISIAPMLDWTDRHYRYFVRLLTKHTLLYTEMVTTGALIHGERERYLHYDSKEHPLALQLGGSNPQELALCARMAEDRGFDEINLNIGCPSDRVQKGRFGACLMAEPELVAQCLMAMQQVVDCPVTIKTRIGIDDEDSYDFLARFVNITHQAGCKVFIIHARKAWLQGLSPKQNREVPPLQYGRVQQLKTDFPHLAILLNGGIKTLDEAEKHLESFDGVMIGREAYHNPYLLSQVDARFYDDKTALKTRREAMEEFMEYLLRQTEDGVYLKHMTRHILGFFNQLPGAKQWRRHLSENAHKPGAGIEIVKEALNFISYS